MADPFWWFETALAYYKASLHPFLHSLNTIQILSTVIAIAIFSLYIHFALPGWRFSHIPGPKYRWLVGNLPDVASKQFHLCHLEWMHQYGAIYRYFLGPMPMIVITDPVLAREVCIQHFKSFHDRFSLTPTEQTPLTMIFGTVDYWRCIRSAVLPLFHSQKLSSYTPLVNECIESLIEELEIAARSNTVIDVAHSFHVTTLDVIGTVVFGTKFTEIDGGKLLTAVQTILKQFNISGEGAPWSAPFHFLSPTIGTILRLALEWLPNSPERLGLDCRRYCSATVHKSSQELRAANRVDFISYMVEKARVDETGAPLTDAQVGAVAIEFILAGSETAATTLGYIAYYLSKYPEAEEKMLEEIDASFEAPTYEDLHKYPYVAAVMKEVLRLVPPAPNIGRMCNADITIGGYHIPKGVKVFVDSYGIHHNAKLYPDPEVFKPERFLPGGEAEKMPPCAYLPFGAGPRMCLGYKLAQEEVMLAVVRLYQRFLLRLTDPVMMKEVTPNMRMGISLAPFDGIEMQIISRVNRDGLAQHVRGM